MTTAISVITVVDFKYSTGKMYCLLHRYEYTYDRARGRGEKWDKDVKKNSYWPNKVCTKFQVSSTSIRWDFKRNEGTSSKRRGRLRRTERTIQRLKKHLRQAILAKKNLQWRGWEGSQWRGWVSFRCLPRTKPPLVAVICITAYIGL